MTVTMLIANTIRSARRRAAQKTYLADDSFWQA
jgi:hypothetical protein